MFMIFNFYYFADNKHLRGRPRRSQWTVATHSPTQLLLWISPLTLAVLSILTCPSLSRRHPFKTLIHHSDLGATSSPCHPCHRSYQKKAVFIKSPSLFTNYHHRGYQCQCQDPGDPVQPLLTDLWWRGRYPLQCPVRTTILARFLTQLRCVSVWHLIVSSLTLSKFLIRAQTKWGGNTI